MFFTSQLAFLNISQCSEENTGVEVSFYKAAGLHASNFIKKETPTQVISCKYSDFFKNKLFHKIPLVAASGHFKLKMI